MKRRLMENEQNEQYAHQNTATEMAPDFFLPTELWKHVCSFLNHNDLRMFGITGKAYKETAIESLFSRNDSNSKQYQNSFMTYFLTHPNAFYSIDFPLQKIYEQLSTLFLTGPSQYGKEKDYLLRFVFLLKKLEIPIELDSDQQQKIKSHAGLDELQLFLYFLFLPSRLTFEVAEEVITIQSLACNDMDGGDLFSLMPIIMGEDLIKKMILNRSLGDWILTEDEMDAGFKSPHFSIENVNFFNLIAPSIEPTQLATLFQKHLERLVESYDDLSVSTDADIFRIILFHLPQEEVSKLFQHLFVTQTADPEKYLFLFDLFFDYLGESKILKLLHFINEHLHDKFCDPREKEIIVSILKKTASTINIEISKIISLILPKIIVTFKECLPDPPKMNANLFFQLLAITDDQFKIKHTQEIFNCVFYLSQDNLCVQLPKKYSCVVQRVTSFDAMVKDIISCMSSQEKNWSKITDSLKKIIFLRSRLSENDCSNLLAAIQKLSMKDFSSLFKDKDISDIWTFFFNFVLRQYPTLSGETQNIEKMGFEVAKEVFSDRVDYSVPEIFINSTQKAIGIVEHLLTSDKEISCELFKVLTNYLNESSKKEFLVQSCEILLNSKSVGGLMLLNVAQFFAAYTPDDAKKLIECGIATLFQEKQTQQEAIPFSVKIDCGEEGISIERAKVSKLENGDDDYFSMMLDAVRSLPACTSMPDNMQNLIGGYLTKFQEAEMQQPILFKFTQMGVFSAEEINTWIKKLNPENTTTNIILMTHFATVMDRIRSALQPIPQNNIQLNG